MNKPLSIIAVIFLLAGAIAIAFINNQKEEGEEGASAGKGGAAVKSSSGAGGASSTETGTSKGSDRAREARERGDAEFVAEYGEARTALSRQVAGNVVALLDDAIAMGEMMSEGGMGGAFGGGRMMVQAALRGTEIELSDEQKDEAAKIYAEFQKRELEKSKGVVNTLKKDSSALMQLFLAGDAQSRGEMTEDEFAEVQGSVGESLADVINPLDRKNFRGGRPMEDEAFRSDLEAILDEDQKAALDAKSEAEAAESEDSSDGPSETSIASIPTMDLETLDEAVGSAKKMTSGFRSMMEGMGTLRQLQPQIEGETGESGEGE